MMRLTWIAAFTLLGAAPAIGQQPATPAAGAVVPAAGGQVQNPAAVQPVAGQTPAGQTPAAPAQPFTPLNANEQARLDQLLLKWQEVSQSTKTLECEFQRWSYDMFAAPAGVHASKAVGVIKYAKPDKGLFKVDQLMFFKGMQQGKPQFGRAQGKFGEHWVCNGRELIEFDQGEKKCTALELPGEITPVFHTPFQFAFDLARPFPLVFNLARPIPFVFDLDAQRIKQRHWVREVHAPKPGIYLIEAWPKREEDLAKYKMVQVALNQKTFMPDALVIYAPNFNAKTAPNRVHYEFSKTKRNAIAAPLEMEIFQKSFIPERPAKDWQVIRESFGNPEQPAANPNQNQR